MLLCPVAVQAQDSHLSQVYEMPLLLNPARTGFFKDNYRLAGIYRSQWKDITQPFKTLSGSLDISVPAGKNKNNIFGFAVMNFADKAGDADYSTNCFEAALSFHKNFGSNFSHYFGIGLLGGFASTSFDLSKMTFDEDFNGGINSDIPAKDNASYPDVSAGMEYNYMNDNMHLNIGCSVFHLNQPSLSYYSNDLSVIHRKYAINAGFAKSISAMLEIQPRIAFFQQGKSTEILLGTDLKIVLAKNSNANYALYLGGYYRVGDALIPRLRIDMGDLAFGLSYDFNTGSLSEINQLAGGPELSIIFTGRVKGVSAGRIYSPRF
ncbi:MAG: PorP/SprF family type IX secretion system membrane protein [Chitinophagales bacterium]|nr:PorP/SprF family type IX secretion system membrane protein [Chitinophagales bacterium]